ncbi:hypothetical protein [Acinetobacter ursingii]|uniref:hypothetical protein n=1 Tax=Acinetobacter ursingii TaxID=108980 RepID=UPI00124CEB2F|nr:hypothetical protein [Acinetobacter ursingii]
MLVFTDLCHNKHVINLSNVNNVVIRNNDGTHVITFHMPEHHVVPATVDIETAKHIIDVLGDFK